MKCLTLIQPFASLLASGLKRIETRNWETKCHGWILIHSSRSFPNEFKGLVYQLPFVNALAGIDAWDDPLQLGVVLGAAKLTRCVRIGEYEQRYIEEGVGFKVPPPSPEFEFGDYTPRRWAWLFNDFMTFKKPFSCRGNMGIWDIPDSILVDTLQPDELRKIIKMSQHG